MKEDYGSKVLNEMIKQVEKMSNKEYDKLYEDTKKKEKYYLKKYGKNKKK